jgi:hypothetical protein
MNGDNAIRSLAVAISLVLVAALVSTAALLSGPDGHDEDVVLQLASEERVPADPPVTAAATTVAPTIVPPATTIPRPVTTRSQPVVTSPPAPPPAAPVAVTGPAERCAAALGWASAHGISLPNGWRFFCPTTISSLQGGTYWGRACMNLPGECPGTKFVKVDIGLIGPNDAMLRYVVVHEICHAIDLEATASTSEPSADACAAAHGAARP